MEWTAQPYEKSCSYRNFDISTSSIFMTFMSIVRCSFSSYFFHATPTSCLSPDNAAIDSNLFQVLTYDLSKNILLKTRGFDRMFISIIKRLLVHKKQKQRLEPWTVSRDVTLKMNVLNVVWWSCAHGSYYWLLHRKPVWVWLFSMLKQICMKWCAFIERRSEQGWVMLRAFIHIPSSKASSWYFPFLQRQDETSASLVNCIN